MNRIEFHERRQEMARKWERTVGWMLLLFCFNVLLALYMSFIVADCKIDCEDKPLPVLTRWVYQCLWWPWVGVAVCVAGIVLSCTRKSTDDTPWNLLIVILIVELVLLFVSAIAFCLPLIRLGVS